MNPPNNHLHRLYHEDGSMRISMIDVRRLLPLHKVKDFNDLRGRGLVDLIEKRFNKYVELGGDHDMEQGGIVNDMEIYPSLFALSSQDIMCEVTNAPWRSDVEIMNQ